MNILLKRMLAVVGALSLALAPRAPAVMATGGNATNDIDGYRIHIFTNSVIASNFAVTAGGNVEVLVVAGGGGGGNNYSGGGGGAGGLISNASYAVCSESNIGVIVGVGGAGGADGSNSVFGSITASGGGGGGSYSANGRNGGSGGGASGGSIARTGGAGMAGQGTNGGNGYYFGASRTVGGGGGGAGQIGANYDGPPHGGAGLASSISGSSVIYAGGGGGGSESTDTPGDGGSGGGGSGSKTGAGSQAVANSGGGGGGAGGGSPAAGGAGGSGIVIVKYRVLTNLVVTVQSASAIGATSATLHGTLESDGGDATTEVAFCWGYADGGTNDGTSAWANVVDLGANWHGGQSFATNITGLISGSTYVYRCYATNSTGSDWSDESNTFTTVSLPSVTNRGPGIVRSGTAWLQGEITVTGGETPYVWFEYWLDGGAATSVWDCGRQSGVFSNNINGLVPDSAYQFHVRASNAAGTVWSTVSNFTTLAGIYVSTNGNHISPYGSWGDAATNIEAALAVATNGDDFVWVSNGIHAVAAQLAITNGATLRSLNGRDATTIRFVGGTGRVLWCGHSNAVVNGFTISGGRTGAGAYGGGLYLSAGTVSDCTLTDNYGEYGGAAYVTGGRLENCNVVSNYQWYTRYAIGGGLFVNGAKAVVSRCRIYANLAYGISSGDWRGNGAGIYLTAGLVTECVISNNYAYGAGGGGYVSGGTVSNCMIVNNQCPGSDNASPGGGLRVNGGLVVNCIFRNNYAANSYGYGGGGVYIDGGTLRNGLFEGNSTPGHGGGIWANGAGAVVENCTVVSNAVTQSSSVGGGIYLANGTLRNSVVYYNTAAGGIPQGNNLYQGGGAVTFSCATELAGGIGNTSAQPDFVDRAGGVYTFLPGSPCLNTGTNQNWMTNGVDLLNNARIVDNMVDMGAYETPALTNGVFQCNFTGTPLAGPEPLRVVFTGAVSGTNTSGSYFWWDFDTNGIWDAQGTNLMVVTNDYTGGLYSVQLVVSNMAGEVTNRLRTGYVAVKGITAYVATNGGHVFPFTTWETAATDLQSAVEAAVSNVWVSNGTYVLAGPVSLTTSLVVRSVNGREATVVQPGGSTRVFSLSHSNAVLSGFTIRNAAVNLVGGGLYLSAGTVSNCTIINCYGQRGGGVYMDGGLLEDCVIASNYQWYVRYEYGGGVAVAGGVMRRCLIKANQAVGISSGDQRGNAGGFYQTAGLITDCVISNNYGYGAGGGGYLTGGTVSNCLLVNNQCPGSDNASPGGGLYVGGGLAANCIFRNNYAANSYGYGGGGAYMAGGTLRNCLLTGNSTPGHGGAIWANGAGALVENCTSVSNAVTQSSSVGGGIYLANGTIRNSVIYYNTAVGGIPSGNNLYQGGGVVTFSCATELTGGSGNTSAQPDYTDWAGNDYSLQPGSPCLNTGTNQGWMTNAVDLVGNARVVDDVVDIGAHETGPVTSGVFRCGFTGTPLTGAEPLRVVFTGAVGGTNASGSYFWWDFDTNGTWDAQGTNLTVVTNDFYGGLYSVQMMVSNTVGEVTNQLRIGYVAVKGITTYAATNGGHVFPFAAWETAATDLQSAVDAAVSNVWVSNGTYILSSPLSLTTAMVVRSVNGRDVTTISQGAPARVLSLSHSNALVSGFGIRNGVANVYGGGISMSAGTVSNCTIMNCYGQRGGGVYMSGGLLEECVIASNYQWYVRGEYGGGVAVAGGVVRRCLIKANQAVGISSGDQRGQAGGFYQTAGLIIDCVISNNYAYGPGGGGYVAGGTISNSLICNNQSPGSDYPSAGGGLYVAGGLAANCIFRNNYAANSYGYGGGGVYMTAGTLRNCLLVGNSTPYYGGGVWLNGAGALVESTSLVSNRVTVGGYYGGGIYRSSGSVLNTIIFFNTVNGVVSNLYGTAAGFTYCCAPELDSGAGNKTGDPLFENQALGNYKLRLSSPCINAGTNQPWMLNAMDLTGNPRVRNQFVDIGAYESLADGGSVIFLR